MLGICSLSMLVSHETLLVPVLFLLWKEERTRIRAEYNIEGQVRGWIESKCTDKGDVWSDEGGRRND